MLDHMIPIVVESLGAWLWYVRSDGNGRCKQEVWQACSKLIAHSGVCFLLL